MTLITILYPQLHDINKFRGIFKKEFGTSYEFISDDDRKVNEIAITFGKNKAIIRYGLPRSEKADIVHLSDVITQQKIIEVIRDFDYPPRAVNVHFPFAPKYVKALLAKRNKPINNRRHNIVISIPTFEHFWHIAIIRVDSKDYSCEPDEEYINAFLEEFPIIKGGGLNG